MTPPCPCGSGKSGAACCQPYLDGTATAPTAEALMKSRFTAYCNGAVDYLFETHHRDSRSANERAEIERSIAATDWLNLLIIDTAKGRAQDSEGHVQFAAAFRKKSSGLIAGGGQAEVGQMHERSFFIREDGAWFYVDGDQLLPHQPKRNDPCWCGSGKKSKQCHG